MIKSQMAILVQQQLAAYNRKDLADFTTCFHPNVKVSYLFSPQLSFSGMETFESTYRQLFVQSPNLHCEIKNRTITDMAVIDEEFVTGLPRYPNGLHVVVVYGFNDDKIDRVWFAL